MHMLLPWNSGQILQNWAACSCVQIHIDENYLSSLLDFLKLALYKCLFLPQGKLKCSNFWGLNYRWGEPQDPRYSVSPFSLKPGGLPLVFIQHCKLNLDVVVRTKTSCALSGGQRKGRSSGNSEGNRRVWHWHSAAKSTLWWPIKHDNSCVKGLPCLAGIISCAKESTL